MSHDTPPTDQQKKVLVAGASGTIGTQLVPYLQLLGYTVETLQRHYPNEAFYWDPEQNILNGSLEGFDAIINLAGYPIASYRWTDQIKKHIYDSRIKATALLVERLSDCKNPPPIFISASATGYYGSSDEIVTETSYSGTGFLAQVCKAWEQAALKAKSFNARVILPRFGIVLCPKGGAMQKMLPIFKACLGGKLGSGKQWMSWIGIDDAIQLLHYSLITTCLEGPVNFTSPNPVTNEEFTKILAKVLYRPSFCTVPSFLLRLMLGELADETLLSSTKAKPCKLLDSGYVFAHPTLKPLFCQILGR